MATVSGSVVLRKDSANKKPLNSNATINNESHPHSRCALLDVQVHFIGKVKKSTAFIIYFFRPDIRGLLWDIFNCTLNSADELLIKQM